MNISMVPIYHIIKLEYYAYRSTTKTYKLYVLSVYKIHCQILKNVQAQKKNKQTNKQKKVSQNEADATTKKKKKKKRKEK